MAALGVTLYAYSVSPDMVAVHYGSSGKPDRWGPREEVLLVATCIISISTALFLALPALFRLAPASMLNLPNKDYWLSPERRDAATAKFVVWAGTIGTAINLLMITLQLSLGPGPSGSPDAANLLPSSLAMLFVAFTLGSCVWLVRSYRLPTRVP